MKVLLVGNYAFDGSTSMQVWADALMRELRQRGVEVEIIAPRVVAGKFKASPGGVGKWLGYIDRYILFPRALRAAADQADVVHICDHGSAVYAPKVRNRPTLVTCHDLLAVRGALGEVPDCPASFFGRMLQQWIRRGLESASCIACVSQYTLGDALRILRRHGKLILVLNGLNYPFRQLDPIEIDRRLAGLLPIDRPFLLHVGSNQPRKNREGVLRIFRQVAHGTDLQMVFAGAPLTPELLRLAGDLQIGDRIVEVHRPDVRVLEALYNRAFALLFPSRWEGFGWPPIEAQACGCPVIASSIPPIAEVLGRSALLRPVEDEVGMAADLRHLLQDPQLREELKRSGLHNVQTRFQTSRMMDDYIALYRNLALQKQE